MDLEKLKNAGKALPSKEYVKQIIARFPNEKDELINTVSSLTMVPCTKEMFGENGIHQTIKEYNFGFMITKIKEPTENYLYTGETYYYILNEAEKTITQQPRFDTIQARYYNSDPYEIKSSEEYIALSDTITFKSTTLPVSDDDIEEFKKYIVKERDYGGWLVSDEYREYPVIGIF